MTAGAAGNKPTTPAEAQKLYPTPQDFANFLDQHWKKKRITNTGRNGPKLTGNTIGDQWLNWYATASKANAAAGYSLGDYEIAFFELAVASSLGTAIASAETATGKVTGDIATGIETAQWLPDPLAGIAGALTAFFKEITNAKMWKSLGWMVLGIWLLAVGIVLWLRIPQRVAGVAADVVPGPGGAALRRLA